MTYGAEADRTVKRVALIILCVVISAAALSCAAYFLLTGTVPLVLFFMPTGTVIRQDHPFLFWLFVVFLPQTLIRLVGWDHILAP